MDKGDSNGDLLRPAKAYESPYWYAKDPEMLASASDHLDEIVDALREAHHKGETWTIAEIFGLLTQNDAGMLAKDDDALDCALALVDITALLAATAIRRLADLL